MNNKQYCFNDLVVSVFRLLILNLRCSKADKEIKKSKLSVQKYILYYKKFGDDSSSAKFYAKINEKYQASAMKIIDTF